MKPEHKELLSGFENYLLLKGSKKRGIEELVRTARHLLEFTETHGLNLYTIGIREAELFREKLRSARGDDGSLLYQAATINGRISHCRAFYKYLIESNRAAHNPFNGIERMKEPVKLPGNILTIEETAKFFNSLETRNADDVKFRTVIELLYSTGARINEIEKLTSEDIDLAGGYIVIRDDKENQERRSPLTESAREYLSIYLDSQQNEPGRKIFIHGKERTLNRWINDRLKRITKRMNLPRITCHSFRHTIATHLIKEGADLREVQEYLGHRRIKNTEIYTRLFPEDLKAAVEKSHPREKRYGGENGTELSANPEPV